MTAETPDNDLAIETELRLAATLFDPVPAPLLYDVIDAFELRTLDAELAELTFDSLSELSLIRAEHEPRILTFSADRRVVEVEVTDANGGWRIIGQLTPPGPAKVELRTRRRSVAAETDTWGRFSAPLEASPFSIRCRWPETARPLVTEWIFV
ncbi:MAG: hypothetical protein ACM30G_19145 [Micromonosporaceae bacterium]